MYSGKEVQDELNLNLYDFGWRQYDPSIGRWISPDPISERYFSYSPYSFALNNPIRFIDPNGLEVIETTTGTTYTGADAQAMFSQLQQQEKNKPRYHTVQEGQSWDDIAKANGVSQKQIYNWNSNSKEDIDNFYHKRGPKVGSQVIISESGHQDYLIRNIANQVAKDAGVSLDDPLLLEVIRQRYGYNEVEAYYDNNLMKSPPNVSGGDSEMIGTTVEAVGTHELEKFMERKGAGRIMKNAVPFLAGTFFSTVLAVLDPSPLGDGTITGTTQAQNAVKMKQINKALDKR